MHIPTLFTFAVFVSVGIPATRSQALVVYDVFGIGFDIFKIGLEIVDLIRKQNEGSVEDLKRELEEVQHKMEQMIAASTTAIIREITLQTKLERIEDIVDELRSLLIDVKNYVLANDTLDREDFKNLFISRFDQRVVAMIRSLPELLTYTIPGLSDPLLALFRDKSRCNMTAIHAFQLFYEGLLTAGVSLQFVFRELSNMTLDDVEKYWREQIPEVKGHFNDLKKICKERMPEYATEDIKQTINADKMFENCKERYTWAWCDILYYPSMGTYQFHYHKAASSFIFWNGPSSSARNQILAIESADEKVKEWDTKKMNTALASKKDTFKSLITGSEDSWAAKKVGEAVEDFVKTKGFLIKAVIVFFDAKELGNVSQRVDKISPVAYVGIEGVTLKYCYSNEIVCTLAKWSLFNFNQDWKEYTGTFNIYVYPCSTTDTPESSRPDCYKHSTSSGTREIQSISIIAILTLSPFLLCLMM